MASTAPFPELADATPSCPGDKERAVLAVLLAHRGRVVGRRELARQAGMADLSARRCDSVLVGVRRLLGADALITVRSRGWRLADHVVDAAHDVLGQSSPEAAGHTNAAQRS